MALKVRRTTMLVLAMLVITCGAVAYAVLQTTYNITHIVTIKGVKVQIWKWIDDLTTPTELKTSHDWNEMGSGQVAYTEFLCITNDGTQNMTLQFLDDLLSTYGTVIWEIEWYDNSLAGWTWTDWQGQIDSGLPYKDSSYVPGTTQNPLKVGQMLGQRPSTIVDKCLGHIRIKLSIATNAPIGETVNFSTTVKGTEY